MKMNTKNKELWRFIAVILAISLFLALALTGTASASPGTTYYVNATGGNDANTPAQAQNQATPWQTITHAVNTVPAGASTADPNIIQVAAGLYDNTTNGEIFAITFDNASIKLIGAGAATTTIDGEGAATILDINATGITVEGFTIKNGTNAIESDDFGGFTILDNRFTNLSDGVHLDIDESSANLATDYTVDDIRIRGNIFNISSDGVYVDIDLDYNATLTGYNVTIGDFDILDNVFNMVTTDGIDIDDIYVNDLNGGSISMGDVNISGNEFYGGRYGIDFYGDFYELTNTTVTAGDVVMNNNTFEDQTSYAMDIDYYDADYWYGTTNGSYGDLVINGNTITSVTTDAIYIDDYAYFEYFYDDASLTVGNLYIESNEINVSGEGIYVSYYYYAYDLDDNASIAMGEVSISGNTIVSSNDYGIYLEYDDVGEDMYGNATVTTGDVHIEENTINADYEAIYVYYEYVACYMENNATLLMGDIYVLDNDISGDSDGIYLYYYGYRGEGTVGYKMYGNASAKLPDYVITGNTFNVTGGGIDLYTDENPYYIYDDAIFDFGGAFIDDNTFSCEHGIYFDYDDFCYDNNDNSATIIGDVTITNNRFYDLDDEAIYIYYEYIGDNMYGYSTLDVGDLVIADNVIDGVGYDGIEVEYYYVESEDDSTVTMGTLDITGNEISNVGYDGIDIDYEPDADDNSVQNIGRALIQGNTIEGCGEAGIDIYMDIDNETGAVVNLGNPVIEGNTISNCSHGIDFEDVEYATIVQNMIVNNTEWDTGVHLDEGSNYNVIRTNCFIENDPQAMDNGTGNDWTGNFWSDWSGSGPYEITGTANNTDSNPLDECPLGQEPQAPAQVPALTPIGMIALVGLLSVIAAISIRKRRRK